MANSIDLVFGHIWAWSLPPIYGYRGWWKPPYRWIAAEAHLSGKHPETPVAIIVTWSEFGAACGWPKGPERWSVRDLFGSKATSSRQTLGFCWSDGAPFWVADVVFNISQWSAELVNPKACTSWPGRPVKRPMRGAWRQHWARGALKLLMLLGGRVLTLCSVGYILWIPYT